MLRKEWSLIVNSLLMQLAAGLFTFLAVYRELLMDRGGSEAALRLIDSGMWLSGPLIITGMILSLFHLGQPLRAYRAVTHIGASWLSREVFFTGTFFALWGISTWMGGSGVAGMILVWLTVSAGLLCALSMSGIYQATGRPGWSGLNTYIHFFGTLMIFGSVGSTIVVIHGKVAPETVQAMPVASVILALLMLAARLIGQIKLIATLKSGQKDWSLDNLVAAAPLPLSEKLASLHQSLTVWGWVLSFFGVALVLYVLTSGRASTGVLMLTVVAGLVLAGESLQRMGFNSLGLSGGMAAPEGVGRARNE